MKQNPRQWKLRNTAAGVWSRTSVPGSATAKDAKPDRIPSAVLTDAERIAFLLASRYERRKIMAGLATASPPGWLKKLRRYEQIDSAHPPRDG